VADARAHALFFVGYSLPWAVLHEFGHVIGLPHSEHQADIMYASIQRKSAILSIGDKLAAQLKYGAPPTQQAPHPPGERPPSIRWEAPPPSTR